MPKALSIIIPTYNEEKLIQGTLTEVHDYMQSRGEAYEVLVMDDGSTDKTETIVLELAKQKTTIRWMKAQKNRGKGMVVRDGVLKAQHPWCLFMDADNATSIKEWPAFESQLKHGARMVIASRHLPMSKMIYPQPLLRRSMGSVYRGLAKHMLKFQASDINCGFKAFETEFAKKVFEDVQMSDWTFDAEVLCLAQALGVKPAEVPVQWSHFHKDSHAGLLTTGRKSFLNLLKLKKRFHATA